MPRRFLHFTLVTFLSAGHVFPSAQSGQPFKLGTFTHGGATFPGLVIEDRLVARLDTADPSLPRELVDIISRYDDLRSRLQAIANRVSEQTEPRPAYVLELGSAGIRPPVLPGTILNAAVNYTEHAQEMRQAVAPAATPAVASAPKSATDSQRRVRPVSTVNAAMNGIRNQPS